MTSISVILMCKLCRGSFRQVDDFIEHKKEKHFTQFQKISCIVFEETEYNEPCPVTIKAETQPTDENIEPLIKIEVNNDDPISPFSSEIIDDPSLGLVEPKSELITYKSEIKQETKNNVFGLKQPEQNPYVLLKRLTSEEIQRASIPKQHLRLIKSEQKTIANESESPNSSDDDSNFSDSIQVKKSTEIQPTAAVINISTEHDFQFECKLCSKQLESNAHLRIHVGICALYHKYRRRFCVACNKQFKEPRNLRAHRLSFHGTEEEKLSLYKFKCHLCPKRYQLAVGLQRHLRSHTGEKTDSTYRFLPRSFKCSQPKCGKAFKSKADLKRHTATHLGLRPFSCSNCNKAFTQNHHLKEHVRFHTGERPYKCTVGNCNKTFICSSQLHKHNRTVHRN